MVRLIRTGLEHHCRRLLVIHLLRVGIRRAARRAPTHPSYLIYQYSALGRYLPKRNKEKVLKCCITILTDDDNAENIELLELWFKVLESVVGKCESKFVAENATKLIKDIPSLKHPFPKRKRGNRLIFAVAKNVGEEGIGYDA